MLQMVRACVCVRAFLYVCVCVCVCVYSVQPSITRSTGHNGTQKRTLSVGIHAM